MANSVIEDYVKAPDKEAPAKDVPTKDDDINAKWESLAILATIGNTKEFLGVNMSLGDVHKLSVKDVEKYYVRYQTILRQHTDGLVESGIQAASKIASYFINVDVPEKLCNTWKNNKLLVRDLSTFAGYLALKGGRLVTLASVTFDLTKHVKLWNHQQKDNTFQDVLGTFQDTLSTSEDPHEKPLEINLEELWANVRRPLGILPSKPKKVSWTNCLNDL